MANRILAGTAAGGVVGLAALAGRYAAGVARADRSWPAQVEARLGDIGAVDAVSIVPLVERLTAEGSGLRGEPDARGPKLVALSSHDSTPWTYDAFARRLGDRYRTLRAGEELRITATSGK